MVAEPSRKSPFRMLCYHRHGSLKVRHLVSLKYERSGALHASLNIKIVGTARRGCYLTLKNPVQERTWCEMFERDARSHRIDVCLLI